MEKHNKAVHGNVKIFCHYFNNDQDCPFDDQCIFAYEESPECRYKESCFRKENCKFFQKELYEQTQDHPSHFLGSTQFRPNRN